VAAGTKRIDRDATGITLLELLITIIAGAIVILGVYRLLLSSLWSYNLQNQMTDMYQNATYTIKRLSETMAQAGADLPEQYYTVIYAGSSTVNDILMRANMGGGKFVISKDSTYTTTTKIKIQVTPDSVGLAFKGADSVLQDTGGWCRSGKIDSVKTGLSTDTVFTHSSSSWPFHVNNVIYAAATKRYFVSGGNFCIDSASNVQAENIDSLSMTFRDANHVPTTDWSKMVSVTLYVRARTASKDPNYKCPGFGDGYHRLALTMDMRFRNRF
jgi:hypothetical protein